MPPAHETQPESGSRTITQTATPTNGAADRGSEAGPSEPVGVLKLRGGPSRRQRVVWSENTVDNEGMGKKKSKICCIYHKPKAYDESSDESESDCDHAHPHSHPRPKAPVKSRRKEEGGGDVEVESSESDGGGGNGNAKPIKKAQKPDKDNNGGSVSKPAKANRYDHQGSQAS